MNHLLNLHGFGLDLLHATWLTVRLALCSLVVGLILGCITALGKLSHQRAIAFFAKNIAAVICGVPELIVIFVLYFGGTYCLSKVFRTYVEVSAFVAGVGSLGLIFAAYSSETIRGAFLALDRGQLQAATAFGFSPLQKFLRIMLPQMWRFALPGLGNLWFVLLKDTSLVSLVGLTDLMSQAGLASAYTHEPFTFYFAAAVIYLALTSLSLIGLRYMERYAARGVRRH